MYMNVFRILGDVSHTASKCILIYAIHSNKSAEGVSLLTQILYIAVFCTRYLDLFWVRPSLSWWNFILKNFYIWSSIYIIVLMTRVYARTREREKAWKWGAYAAGASLVAAPIVSLIFNGWKRTTFVEVLWTFSIILESVCVLPQLLLLRQTTVPTVIDSFYLVTLGSYRAFYLLNWIYRAFTPSKPDPISVIFGIVQTAFYLDFAWVYWTRQRVKLRGGSVVDTDDLRKGWLVDRVINHALSEPEEDPEAGPEETDGAPRQPKVNRWGRRGISISADDTLHEHDTSKKPRATAATPEEDPILGDEDAFASDLDDDVPELNSPRNKVLNNHEEWRHTSPSNK
ncbi:ER lumen protein-retaining receptor [Exophiala dermatitidis]